MKRKSDEHIDLRTALTVTRDVILVIALICIAFILFIYSSVWIAC